MARWTDKSRDKKVLIKTIKVNIIKQLWGQQWRVNSNGESVISKKGNTNECYRNENIKQECEVLLSRIELGMNVQV